MTIKICYCVEVDAGEMADAVEAWRHRAGGCGSHRRPEEAQLCLAFRIDLRQHRSRSRSRSFGPSKSTRRDFLSRSMERWGCLPAGLSMRASTTSPPWQTSLLCVPPLAGGSAVGKAALAVAIQEMQAGHGEEGGDNRGQHVRTYLNSQVAEGSSWCAGFVSYCFRQALGRDGVFGYIVGAQALQNKMKSLGQPRRRRSRTAHAGRHHLLAAR